MHPQAGSSSELLAKDLVRRNAAYTSYEISIKLDAEFLHSRRSRRTFSRNVPLCEYLFYFDFDELVGPTRIEGNTPAEVLLFPIIFQFHPCMPKSQNEGLGATSNDHKSRRRRSRERKRGRILQRRVENPNPLWNSLIDRKRKYVAVEWWRQEQGRLSVDVQVVFKRSDAIML